MNIVERAKNLIVQPKQEWAAIDGEPHTVQGLYTQYVMILAAIPAVASFIGYSLVAIGVLRVPFAAGLAYMVLGYVLSLAAVYGAALAIDVLAPHFGGQRSFMQAFKVAAFFPTAAWVAGIVAIVPLLAIVALIGTLYTFYLLFLGLPVLMRVPQDKAVPYFAVVLVVIIVLGAVIAMISGLAIPARVRGF